MFQFSNNYSSNQGSKFNSKVSNEMKKKDIEQFLAYSFLEVPKIYDKISCLNLPCCPLHQDQKLSMVCIDENCPNKSLICPMCQGQEHLGHNTMSLKLYLSGVFPQDRGEEEGVSVLGWGSILQGARQEYFGALDRMRESICDSFRQMKEIGVRFFQKIGRETKEIVAISNGLEIIQALLKENDNNNSNNKNDDRQDKNNGNINGCFNNIDKLKKFMAKMLQTNGFTKFSLKNRLQKIKKQVDKMSSSLFTNVTQAHKVFMKVLDNQNIKVSSFISNNHLKVQERDDTPSKFYFNNELKGAKMEISQQGKVITQTGMQSSGQRFALLLPSLKKPPKIYKQFKDNKPQIWAIKVFWINGWVGVGIALRKMLKSKNLCFQYNGIGHGSYLLSANGYSWSHSVKSLNSHHINLSFTNGDVIIMQYDPYTKKLKFYKNSMKKGETFQMDVDDPGDDEYCPCVNLSSPGDCVQVVDPYAYE